MKIKIIEMDSYYRNIYTLSRIFIHPIFFLTKLFHMLDIRMGSICKESFRIAIYPEKALGPKGEGKTTVLDMISPDYKLAKGRIIC